MQLAIVGVGALGSELCLQMAADAVLPALLDPIHVIDPDRITAENLSLSRLFAQAQRGGEFQVIGAPKAEVVAHTLRQQTPCAWIAHAAEIADLGWPTLATVDLLISCTDSALARAETTLVARALGVPLLDGGVRGEAASGGRVAWFPAATEAACYLCGLSTERRANLLRFAEATALGCSAPAVPALGGDAGVSPSLQAVATALVEHLRALATGPEGAARAGLRATEAVATRLWPAGAGWTRERVLLRRSPSCPWHGARPAGLVPVQPDETFGGVLEGAIARLGEARAAGGWRLQFAWPVCVLAVCRACGAQATEPRRLATLRQRSRCTECSSAAPLEPLRTVSSVGQKEWMAQATPRQLGWAEPQLLQLRREMVPAGVRGEEAV